MRAARRIGLTWGRTALTRGVASVATAIVCGFASASSAANVPTAMPAGMDMNQAMWMSHIEPILSKNCFKCHAGEKQKGGLDLRTISSILAGGTDGSVLTPGRPGESPIFQRLQPGVEGHMPPDKSPQLSSDEVTTIQAWISTISIPTAHLSAAAAAIDAQSAPSLVEMANKIQFSAPWGMGGSDVIDLLIQKDWHDQHVTGNAVCDDRTFARRIYLDLAGRIPTHDELESFVASTESDKRTVLVDKLLASDDYAKHMAEVLDTVLMERKGKAAEFSRKSHGWFDYLQSSIAHNRPWDMMVSDLITARPQGKDQRGAVWFLYERQNNYQAMAEAVAPVAFGVSVACAQCHNHPMAHEIKQQHYWGLVAAFNRTANVTTNDGAALTESAVGGFVNFTNLKKESQPAILSFPNDRMVDEKRPKDLLKDQDSDGNYVLPPKTRGKARSYAVPKFSRRQSLADAVTRDNPLLARAFVNRMWALMLGRGFVNPVDQMDSKHPATHPELLTWLSEDFEASGYDIRHLIREIVLSKTYQLDSRWNDSTPPLPDLFARGLEKPLPAESLYRSLVIASGDGSASEKVFSANDTLRQSLIDVFPGMFEVDYVPTLSQTMFLTNSPTFAKILAPSGENLSARMLKLSTSTDRVKLAFNEIYGRDPAPAELADAVTYLDARADRPEAGVRQLTWALLTSTEFLVNH